ncbi:heterokaryon incompatibility protein-domain-containing protein, partial [Leptodontidium sp. MPI-SDFR-AT-0119]
WPSLGYNRPLAVNSGSIEAFQFIEEQIHECLVSHDESVCSKSQSHPLPKRILQIGSEGDERLVLLETAGESARYATLSHCWGGGNVLKTTEDSLKCFKQGIDLALLPKTFLDAVTVARKIAIRFLWIDSLCIIQNSEEDWQIESSKMGSYYQNAFITIAASSSKDANSPFLQERASWWDSQEISHEDSEGNPFAVIAQRRQRPDRKLQNNPLGHLSTRAWTFQENMLSTRIIHYTSSEIVWECRRKMVSEDGTVVRTDRPELGLASKLSVGSEFNPWNHWQEIVIAYSTRDLTFSIDKLPALSGIASKIQSLTSFEYVAGLWKQNLLADLLWFSHSDISQWNAENLGRGSNGLEHSRPLKSTSGAPSWSWASIDGGVDYRVLRDPDEWQQFEPFLQLKSVDATVRGLNPFGAVTGGSITATGPTVEAVLISKDTAQSGSYQLFREGEPIPEDCSTLLQEIGADMCTDTILEHREVHLANGSMERTIQRSVSTIGTSEIRGPVLVLMIGLITRSPRVYELGGYEHDRIYALVLARSETAPDIYTRLGVMEIHKHNMAFESWSSYTKVHLHHRKNFFHHANTTAVTII